MLTFYKKYTKKKLFLNFVLNPLRGGTRAPIPPWDPLLVVPMYIRDETYLL